MKPTNIDITKLLESYVDLLEKSGIPRESTESELMLCAKEEIETLRRAVELERDVAQLFNQSRLAYKDKLIDLDGKRAFRGWKDGDRVSHNGREFEVKGVDFNDGVWCMNDHESYWLKESTVERIEEVE